MKLCVLIDIHNDHGLDISVNSVVLVINSLRQYIMIGHVTHSHNNQNWYTNIKHTTIITINIVVNYEVLVKQQ